MAASLPEGWTLQRVRKVAQDPTACFAAARVRVVIETFPHGMSGGVELEWLDAGVILLFDDLARASRGR